MTEKEKNSIKNAKLLKEQFRKVTPLAHVIWERDEIKSKIKEKRKSNKKWLSEFTKQIGKVAHETNAKQVDSHQLEEQLIITASTCLVWIENLREQEKQKKAG